MRVRPGPSACAQFAHARACERACPLHSPPPPTPIPRSPPPPIETWTAASTPPPAPLGPCPSSCRCRPTRRAGGRLVRADRLPLHPRPISRAV
eukprot:3427964-Pleurochrysis_carterae.AAC.1